MKTATILDITIDDRAWAKLPRLKSKLEKAAILTLGRLPPERRYPCVINLLLTNNDQIRALNRDFRGKPKPTNILSFPQFDPPDLPKKSKSSQPVYIGDIAMGYQYIVDECSKDHKLLINHVTHLLIHGILHLFGYHHSSDRAARLMETLETEIMDALKLPDPYAAPLAAARRQ